VNASRAETVVVALGNVLLRDEGVAIHVLRELAKSDLSGVDLEDLGTSGMAVLHSIAGRRRAVIIDCARMGVAPGEIRRFRPAEARSAEPLPRLSVHEGDLLDILRLSHELGQAPEDVIIYGIEPADISPGTELSAILKAHLSAYCEMILRDLLPPGNA